MANTIIRPTIFAKEVIRNYDRKNVFMNYVNRDYEWTIKQAWDTVRVQILPTVNFTTLTNAWDAMTATPFTITAENLVIDRVKWLMIRLTEAEKTQSNLNLEMKVAERVAEAQARLMDDEIVKLILVDQVADIPAANKLNSGSPITLTKNNVYEAIENLKVALANQNVTDNLVCFVAPFAASLLRQSWVLDASDRWLEVRQRGYLGLISGVELVETNALTASREMIMMAKNAVNAVVQLNNYDVRKWPDGFYENLIAEVVYGMKIFSENAKAIAIQYVA